eukprot:1161628-Pelagomonas_calceolata.AAC.2
MGACACKACMSNINVLKSAWEHTAQRAHEAIEDSCVNSVARTTNCVPENPVEAAHLQGPQPAHRPLQCHAAAPRHDYFAQALCAALIWVPGGTSGLITVDVSVGAATILLGAAAAAAAAAPADAVIKCGQQVVQALQVKGSQQGKR